MAEYFITSDGRRIRFLEGWYEAKTEWPLRIKNIKEFTERVFSDNPKYPIGYEFFKNKLVVFNYFYEFINEYFTDLPKWTRSLDIGTGPAIQPRLMKGAGLCEEVWGLDIVDRSTEFSDDLPVSYLKRLKDDMSAVSNLDSSASFSILRAIQSISQSIGSDYPIHTPYTILSDSSDFTLDRYIVSDFTTYDFGNEKFDIITGIMSAEHFEPSSLFKKVCSLLSPNGLLFIIVDFWYDLFGGSMSLPMDTPWLHARVSREDLVRYYREVRPDISKYAEKCIYFKKSHMTPADYNVEAKSFGLKAIAYRRTINSNLILPFTVGKVGKLFYSEILPQSKIINPKVGPSDLFTHYLTMLFVKE